jgi:hypothetical protein
MRIRMNRRCAQHEVHQPHAKTQTVKIHAQPPIILYVK